MFSLARNKPQLAGYGVDPIPRFGCYRRLGLVEPTTDRVVFQAAFFVERDRRSAMSPDGNSKSPALRIYSALIAFSAFATTILLVPRIFLNFKNQYFLTHVEGVWLACAHDFVHGVFYRPLFGPLGYGGTRYFPLDFLFSGWVSKPCASP